MNNGFKNLIQVHKGKKPKAKPLPRRHTIGVRKAVKVGKPVKGPGRTGRPRTGHKRFSPDHQQVTAYIPKDVYQWTKINLIKADGMQFSVLITNLLRKWNMGRK